MTIDTLTTQLEALTQHGIVGMDDTQIKEHRKQILALTKQCNKALGATTQKEHNYDDDEVKKYIQLVLTNGDNLVHTKLSTNPELEDAQHLAWWKQLIKVCVQQSPFGADTFKVKALAYQRAAIEQSTTLHELRQSVKAMIGPLGLYREITAVPEPLEYELPTEEQLIIENEQLTLELTECKRMLSEITQLYDVSLTEHRSKQQVIDAVNNFKVEHSCSDEEACKVLNISRSTIKRMRKDVLEETST